MQHARARRSWRIYRFSPPRTAMMECRVRVSNREEEHSVLHLASSDVGIALLLSFKPKVLGTDSQPATGTSFWTRRENTHKKGSTASLPLTCEVTVFQVLCQRAPRAAVVTPQNCIWTNHLVFTCIHLIVTRSTEEWLVPP